LIACAVAASWSIPARAAPVLITEEEARLPPPRATLVADRRGITRAPRIDLVAENEPVRSPMHFQLKFAAFGGARIDPESVKLTYLRTTNIDLTARVASFVQAAGIDIPEAELPVGEHTVRVDVRDSDGRASSTSFVLRIVP
jgi:hypothetical protein